MLFYYVYEYNTTKVQNLHFLNHNFKLKCINLHFMIRLTVLEQLKVLEQMIRACKLIDESKLLEQVIC